MVDKKTAPSGAFDLLLILPTNHVLPTDLGHFNSYAPGYLAYSMYFYYFPSFYMRENLFIIMHAFCSKAQKAPRLEPLFGD